MSELIKREPSSAPVVYEARPQNIWIDEYLDEKESEINRIVRNVLERKWLVLAVALAVMAAASAWTFTTTPLYKSTVKIQIDPEQRILPYAENRQPW